MLVAHGVLHRVVCCQLDHARAGGGRRGGRGRSRGGASGGGVFLAAARNDESNKCEGEEWADFHSAITLGSAAATCKPEGATRAPLMRGPAELIADRESPRELRGTA